ncbi:MAG: hypothetical protein WBV91_20285, partial [Desulfobacterales bacterium]
SADFCQPIPAPCDAGSTRQIGRSPRVMRTHLHAYARRIYGHAFRTGNYRRIVANNYKELETKRRRNGPNLEEYAAAEYKSYIGETKYLKLLKKDDISRIIIRGDKNAKRDSYRNVLPIIKWYLEGAVEGIDKMSGSTLTKAIGLE